MNKIDFELWLEFEHTEPKGDPGEDEFFNMRIIFADGRTYSLNVWTYRCLEGAIQYNRTTGENVAGAYLYPPDLLVERMDRDLLRKIVEDMLGWQGLNEEWLARGEEG